MNQKGLAWLPIIFVGIIIGAVVFFSFKSKKENFQQAADKPAESTISARLFPSDSLKATPAATTKSFPTPATTSKPTCDQNKAICFESNDLSISITEGYTEDNDKWITDKLYIIGQTEKGYEINWEGIPGEFTYYSPDKSFPNGKKLTIYVRAFKDSAKKGTYKGKISVKALGSGITTTANLTLNYVDWKDSDIHVEPKEISLNCEIVKEGVGAYPGCINQLGYIVKLYYFGKHHDLGVKTEMDKDTSKGIKLYPTQGTRWYKDDKAVVFDMENTQSFDASFDGFPSLGSGALDQVKLENEPNGTYKGTIIFNDRTTQKELFRVPYTLNIKALNK